MKIAINNNEFEIQLEVNHLDNSIANHSITIENITDTEVESIINALTSHDTQLADIDRLLDRLEVFADAHKSSEVKRHYTPQAEDENISNLRAVEHSAIITMGDIALAHQIHEELREKYPKE